MVPRLVEVLHTRTNGPTAYALTGVCLAVQAEARQEKFNTSAVGKAAKKAVDAAKKEKEAAPQGADRARDWLS